MQSLLVSQISQFEQLQLHKICASKVEAFAYRGVSILPSLYNLEYNEVVVAIP